jgi:hypothetical protein
MVHLKKIKKLKQNVETKHLTLDWSSIHSELILLSPPLHA